MHVNENVFPRAHRETEEARKEKVLGLVKEAFCKSDGIGTCIAAGTKDTEVFFSVLFVMPKAVWPLSVGWPLVVRVAAASLISFFATVGFFVAFVATGYKLSWHNMEGLNSNRSTVNQDM